VSGVENRIIRKSKPRPARRGECLKPCASPKLACMFMSWTQELVYSVSHKMPPRITLRSTALEHIIPRWSSGRIGLSRFVFPFTFNAQCSLVLKTLLTKQAASSPFTTPQSPENFHKHIITLQERRKGYQTRSKLICTSKELRIR
jgi:hypothetical protein